MAPGLTQTKFYGRAVIHTMSCAVTYGGHAGLWVRSMSAISNRSKMSYQVMTGYHGLSVTGRLCCALTLSLIFCCPFDIAKLQ